MKITSWNVNSLRIRLDGLRTLIARENPDILCLQEVKCTRDTLPLSSLEEMGYPHVILNGQKGYHGVALLSKLPLTEAYSEDWARTGEARHVAVSVPSPNGTFMLHVVYAPAGGDIPDESLNDKFAAKLSFWRNMTTALVAEKHKPHLLIGDFNIAPLEWDVWNHKAQLKAVGHTPLETEHVARFLLNTEAVDIGRRTHPHLQPHYTWWTYRLKGLYPDNSEEENREALLKGWRLDHVYATASLAPHVRGYKVLQEARLWQKPSDHAPITVEV